MKTVMILDDETKVLSALQRYLTRHDWKVHAFTNPEDAIKFAQSTFIPLVISDYRMPEMNGVDFLVEFQKHQPQAFKIILSGQADQEAMTNAINFAEVDRFVHKPWDNDKLLKELESGLARIEKVIADNAKLDDKLSPDELRIRAEEMLEKETPGITKVRRNELGWIEIE